MQGVVKEKHPTVDISSPLKRWKVRQSLLGGYKKEFPANDIPCGKNVIYSS